MNTPHTDLPGREQGATPGDAPELPPRARGIVLVAWCSFLAAALATMVVFAVLDPEAVPNGEIPSWWQSRHSVYAIGFFFFWFVAACASALTYYMVRTDRTSARD